MAKVQGSVGSVQGVYNNAGNLIGFSNPSQPSDGVDSNFSTISIDSSGNTLGLSDASGMGVIFKGSTKPMLTAICGNSIAAACQKAGAGADNSYWSFKNTVFHANTLTNSALRFARVTATTRSDGYGTYGYSGQTLPTINADIGAQWISQFSTANGIPELVIGYGLLENDIGGGATYAAMQKSLSNWLSIVQNSFPGVTILLATPHPSFSYDSATKVTAYQQIKAYMLSLDNGYNLFVSDMSAYENSASPGTPLGTAGSPIYTDASVHPNGKGAFLLARTMAKTIKRFIQVSARPYLNKSNNLIFTGSQAASGTNTTGTMPNPCEGGGGSSAGSRVFTAENGGWLQTITNTTGGFQDFSSQSASWTTITGTQLSAFGIIQIVSGAENIGLVEIQPQFNDGTTSFWLYPLLYNTGDVYPDYQNGDVISIYAPPEVTTHSTITACNTYIRIQPNASCPAGGQYTVRLIASGCAIVA